MTHQQAGFDTQLPSGLNNDIRAPPKAVEGGSSIGRDHRSIAKPAGRIFVFDRRRAAPIRIEALISETSLLPTHGDANCICGKDKEGEGVSSCRRLIDEVSITDYDSTLAKVVARCNTEIATASLRMIL